MIQGKCNGCGFVFDLQWGTSCPRCLSWDKGVITVRDPWGQAEQVKLNAQRYLRGKQFRDPNVDFHGFSDGSVLENPHAYRDNLNAWLKNTQGYQEFTEGELKDIAELERMYAL